MKSESGDSLPAKNKNFSRRDGIRSWRSRILTTAGIFGWIARTPRCACLRKPLRPDRHPDDDVRRARPFEDQLILAQKSEPGLPVEYAALEARSDRQQPPLAPHQQVAAR